MSGDDLASALLDATDDAIVGYADDGVVFCWNGGAERLFGFSADEAIGQNLNSFHSLVPPDRVQENESLLREVGRGERIERFETVRLDRHGRRVPVLLTLSPVRNSDGTIFGVLCVARRHVGLSASVTHAGHDAVIIETASRVALDILASRTGVEALHHIAEAARTLSGAQYAALGVARADGQGLLEFITTGLSPEAEAEIGPRPRGAGVLGLLLQRTEPLCIDVLAEHPASVGFPPNHPPMTSFLGVPIRHGDIVLGSLYLTNKTNGEPFTPADIDAVQAIGAHAAVAIHSLQMLVRQRDLFAGLINAHEEERRAVAYELHDGLTQFVMAAHAHLESFRRASGTGNAERAARELDQGLRYLKEAVMESRRLVNGLRALALDDLGLAGAVELLLSEEKGRAGWSDADLIHNIAGRRYDKSLETAVYRVAQEALTNARKHAEASRVRLLLLAGTATRNGAPSLTLEVRDWGKGFVPESSVTGEYKHFGLHGMFERVNLLGGTPSLKSAPGEGTVVSAVFPVLDRMEEDE